MCHWKKWVWPGAITVIILSLLAIWMKRDFIQQDLASKANDALQANGQSWAKVMMDGRDATLLGSAPSEEDQLQAAEHAGKAYSVRIVKNMSDLIAKQSPYTFQAKQNGNNIELIGFVPHEKARAKILESAKQSLPQANVKDALTLARGAPEGFETLAGFGLKQLAGLTDGGFSISDTDLSINGTARSQESYSAINQALTGNLPAGVKLADNSIRPIEPVVKELKSTLTTVSPFVWGAVYNGSQVILSGVVPSEESRVSILSAVQNVMPDATISDRMGLANGASESFPNAVQFAISHLPRFSEGSVSLSGQDLSISGTTNSTTDYELAKQALVDPLPAGLNLALDGVSPPVVSPFSWSADFDGSKVMLNGFVPNDQSRQQMLAHAQSKFPNAQIIDHMQVASGAAENYNDATASAISVLPRFSKGSVALSGENLIVMGTGKSSTHYLAADRYIETGLPKSVNLISAEILPPAHEGDYGWEAKKTGSHIVLSGLVTSKEERIAVAKRAAEKNPGMSVINRLTIESGAHENFAANIEKGFAILADLGEGAAVIKNGDLMVNGVAASVASRDSALGKMAGIEGEITPATLSSYSWSIEKLPNKVVLGGFVPNQGMGNIHIAASKATLNLPVDDQQRLALGAPDGFGNAAAALISAVNKLDESSASITGTNVSVKGKAQFEDEAIKIGEEIAAALPDGYKLRKQISYPLPGPTVEVMLKPAFVPKPVVALKPKFVPKPVAEPQVIKCDVDFIALIDGEKIQFDTDEATIKTISHPLLSRIGSALGDCDNSQIEIGGHTDVRGSERYNLELSEKRAQAVVDYLVQKAGVSGNGLLAKGYGEENPIAPDTDEERAKNRRIEFKVLKQ